MIFRQLFDAESSTYTYLLAARRGGEALLIDPVIERAPQYLQLLDELGVKLVFAVDTHVHADHVTALGSLRNTTGCVTIMGEQSRATCVSRRVRDGEDIAIDGLRIRALYTPGHTDDSYSFVMDDRVFTGDTLLIRGTGRTDFQNGDPGAQYDSIFGRLLTLPDETLVYPAHDYKGWTVSTVGEEKAHNPRLQVSGKAEYIELMNGLDLPNPKLMDIAVPANLACGLPTAQPGAAGGNEAPQDFPVSNATSPEEGVLTSGAPSPEDLAEAARSGVNLVISLRSPSEAGEDALERAAEEAKLRFERIQVAGPDDVSADKAAKLDAVLADNRTGRTLVYCASSNRVGALFALRAHAHGADDDAALGVGRAAGLASLEGTVRARLAKAHRRA